MSPILSLSRRGALALMTALVVTSAAQAQDVTLKVGIMGGEDEQVWAAVTAEAKPAGLIVEAVPFNDYTQPNEALANKDIDANAFQHGPYLEAQIAAHGYELSQAFDTAIFPIGVYSKTYKTLEELPEGAIIGLPNDPSNGGRALKVLEQLGLIKLDPEAGILATVIDVTENPRGFDLRELDAGVVGRAIDDLDAAVVNTDWAFKAGLLDHRIAEESGENNPYMNFLAIRTEDKDAAWVETLRKAFQSDAVKEAYAVTYKGSAVTSW
ncbi:MetQ/NlpA family ABC transporter substrate-binding protein [Xinfangfangia sp. CPCC 101601]|uniref:Lipoprotein n=1 Tax=Pseudogemmobacter lacusdianii TaxID=3069608 RepID=A0ABU0VZD1_9RHOB|nr:MetQ/NlpA family ABC transporter substrate-binding protein [Xinfangfangia sp. CPCC 101601]MDQ2067064.1 MetQ/NlpA family ABC transporter substrate-binding protein [Xinfangfangia sp. CPCC 101601]